MALITKREYRKQPDQNNFQRGAALNLMEREPARELIPICRWCYPTNPPELKLQPFQDTTNKICPKHYKELMDSLTTRRNEPKLK